MYEFNMLTIEYIFIPNNKNKDNRIYKCIYI